MIPVGMKDFLQEFYPDQLNLPAVPYEHIFTSPWASTSEKEQRHKILVQSIGERLKGQLKSGYSV